MRSMMLLALLACTEPEPVATYAESHTPTPCGEGHPDWRQIGEGCDAACASAPYVDRVPLQGECAYIHPLTGRRAICDVLEGSDWRGLRGCCVALADYVSFNECQR